MGGWVLRERGAPACRGTRAGRRPGEGGGSCPLPLYGRLPSVGIPADEDSPSVLLRHQENCHQETPSHALPGLAIELLCATARSRAPSRKGTGSWGTGGALGRHLPRAPTRDRGQDGPAETSQLCVPGWLPASRLPPLPWPATLPAGPASCPCRNAPAGSGSDTCLLPDGQAAACCRLLEPSMPGPCRGVCCPPGLLRGEGVSPAPRTGLGCCCLITNPPRERGELSCLLPLSETYLLDKDEYKQDFCPGPDITPSWRILGLQLYQYNKAKNKEILNLNQCS